MEVVGKPFRFQNPCPPLTEVFAFRTGRPCRVEEGSQPSSGSDLFANYRCPYAKECELTAAGLPLDMVYHGSFKVTLGEYSSSLIIRSEHQYSRDDRLRMSLRKHLHELNADRSFHVVVTNEIREAIQKRLEDLKEPTSLAWATVSGSTPQVMLTTEEIKRLDQYLGELEAEEKRWWNTGRDDVKREFASWLESSENTAIGNPADAEAWASIVVEQLFAPMRCHELTTSDRFGKYLGFVDLRLNSQIAPLALGLLVAPRHLRHDPMATYIVSECSQLFGCTGFGSTVYTMHEPRLGGARCAQACVIMASGILADRGAQLHGSYELTYLAKRREADQSNEFEISGLNFKETADLLDGPVCRTTAHEFRPIAEDLPADIAGTGVARHWRRLGERLIEAYVLARCPILLFVDAKTWNPAYVEPGGHAVVITGFRRRAHSQEQRATPGVPVRFRADLFSDLIVHDPSLKPYAIWPADACFYASACFQDEQEEAEEPSRYVNLILVAPRKIELHAFQRFRQLCQHTDPVRGRDDSQLAFEYWTQEEDKDLRFALVHRDDVEAVYFSSEHNLYAGDRPWGSVQLGRTRRRIRRQFPRALVNGRYWAIAGYQDGKLRTLWLCNTQRPEDRPDRTEDVPWEWRFDVTDQGTHLGNTPGDKDFSMVALFRLTERAEENEDAQQQQQSAGDADGCHSQDAPTDAATCDLRPSVITSSSDRSLRPLLDEVLAIDKVDRFDLYVLRDRDVRDIVRGGEDTRLFDPTVPQQFLIEDEIDRYSCADLMALPENVPRVESWVRSQFTERPEARIAAFATYFPQIVNECTVQPRYANARPGVGTLRDVAVDALANTICLGLDLKQQDDERRDLWANDVIVEIVCGSILGEVLDEQERDETLDEQDRRTRIRIGDDGKKIRVLLESLVKVVEKVRQRRPDSQHRWALGLELEPGETYVLRETTQLELLVKILGETHFELLRRHLGLNLDIAHVRMSNVTPLWLSQHPEIRDLVVHAHITDHPGMHTRDQHIGLWMPVDRFDAEEYKFLYELAKTGSERSADGVPFSGCVALELEGCGRISWVHSSLTSLRQMCEALRNYGNVIRERRT